MTDARPARHGPCVTVIGVALVALASADPARAHSEPSWPAECGSRAELEAHVVALAPRLRDVPFDVSITHDGERYRASLALGDGGRTLESASCPTLTSAIARIVSTAATAEREAGPDDGPTVRALLMGSVVVGIGPLPSLDLSVVPTVGVHIEGVELHASIAWLGLAFQNVTSLVGQFRLGYVFAIDDVELGPFLVSEAGELSGASSAFYATFGGAAIARWWADRVIGLQLSLDLTVPLTATVLSDGYAPPDVSALVGAGVILRIP